MRRRSQQRQRRSQICSAGSADVELADGNRFGSAVAADGVAAAVADSSGLYSITYNEAGFAKVRGFPNASVRERSRECSRNRPNRRSRSPSAYADGPGRRHVRLDFDGPDPKRLLPVDVQLRDRPDHRLRPGQGRGAGSIPLLRHHQGSARGAHRDPWLRPLVGAAGRARQSRHRSDPWGPTLGSMQGRVGSAAGSAHTTAAPQATTPAAGTTPAWVGHRGRRDDARKWHHAQWWHVVGGAAAMEAMAGAPERQSSRRGGRCRPSCRSIR